MPRNAEDSLWYKRAAIYEVSLRAFQDGNGDGIGDFPGLIARMDYLQWLGVDCIWLLPFNASPLRDGGYDVADFYSVLPAYGTIEDVRRLLGEAHRRDISVIMDLVINHTSDQHPWFQAARSSPDNPYRDWYVWSGSTDRYAGARIIFLDTEHSNWTWDEQAGAYFWHRFYSHQPDLNYDNPAVRAAVLDVARFWLGLGIDGLRLDAVPYLFEREGTNGENLPETHAFLAEMRAMVNREFPNCLLLSEANQWPRDLVQYFGTAERPECHMNFQFALMPRLFMALAQGRRDAIVEILGRTPPVPDAAQWAIFLRNHDELTLEMVTGEERQYMWNTYARDPRMKLNLGIRRRLAPLLDHDRRRLELMFGLLLSLPGTPIIYYGDELGMGDNVDLADRDGVRTPMQWCGEENGGFSQAKSTSLYPPPLTDAVYGYQVNNVAAQRRDESSLLHWVRERLLLRRRWPVFGRGAFTLIESDNSAVFAFLRSLGDMLVLCVYNLSHQPQQVNLDLSPYAGCVPLDLVRRTGFPAIGSMPYRLALAGHAGIWIELKLDSHR